MKFDRSNKFDLLLWASKFATGKIELPSKLIRNGQINNFGCDINLAVGGLLLDVVCFDLFLIQKSLCIYLWLKSIL